MANHPKSLQCLEFPRANPVELLTILAELADTDMEALVAADVKVARINSQSWHLYLPVSVAGKLPKGVAFEAVKDSIKLAYKVVAGRDVGREADAGYSVPANALINLVEAAVLLTIETPEHRHYFRPTHERMRPTSLEPESKLLFTKGPLDRITPVISDVIRKGRDVRSGGAHRLSDGQMVGLLLFTDAPEDYGAVSSYLVRQDLPAPVTTLLPVRVGSIRLWLEEDTPMPEDVASRALARILHAARGAKVVPERLSDLICLRIGDFRVDLYFHQAETIGEAPSVAERLTPTRAPVQPYNVTSISVVPDAEASQALTEHIHRLRRQVGYQVSLEPVRHGMTKDSDLVSLAEQIDDLQLQIKQIRALGAPQRCLMRFSDAQLPAMIDGLRKLDPSSIQNGTLVYAVSHSAGRGEPAHYLSYDPADTFIRIAEVSWRAETDVHPISYWLEPFVTEAQVERPSNTQVFVPTGHFLVPSLAHFGGDIDETLRLTLGNLFDSSNPLMSDRSRSPYYLFTPSAVEDFRFEVEVIDGAAFAPLRQKLHWLNDYLQLRSPVDVDPAHLEEVARGLYEGDVAQALRDDIETDLCALDQHWSETQQAINQQAMSFVTSLSDEIAGISERIADLHHYLKRASHEMAALEDVVQDAVRILDGQDRVMVKTSLNSKDAEMTDARNTFESRVAAELELADTIVSKNQRRIAKLQDRLRRINEWGAE